MKKCEIRKNIRHAAASIKPAVSYLYGTVAIGLPGAVLFNLSARHSGPVGAVWLLVTAIAMTAGAMVYLAVHKCWNKLSIKTIKGTIRSNGPQSRRRGVAAQKSPADLRRCLLPRMGCLPHQIHQHLRLLQTLRLRIPRTPRNPRSPLRRRVDRYLDQAGRILHARILVRQPVGAGQHDRKAARQLRQHRFARSETLHPLNPRIQQGARMHPQTPRRRLRTGQLIPSAPGTKTRYTYFWRLTASADGPTFAVEKKPQAMPQASIRQKTTPHPCDKSVHTTFRQPITTNGPCRPSSQSVINGGISKQILIKKLSNSDIFPEFIIIFAP